LYKSETAKKL